MIFDLKKLPDPLLISEDEAIYYLSQNNIPFTKGYIEGVGDDEFHKEIIRQINLAKNDPLEVLWSPDDNKVLGVFGEYVHLKGEYLEWLANGGCAIFKAVIVTTKDEYLRMWSAWLDGKRDCCERYNYYCGYGFFRSLIIKELKNPITVIEIEEDDAGDLQDVEYSCRAFLVDKFEEDPEFEHG